MDKTARWLREKLTEQAVKNASSSVDAASIVFAHSILDEALGSFVEITGEVASDYWKEKMQSKKAGGPFKPGFGLSGPLRASNVSIVNH